MRIQKQKSKKLSTFFFPGKSALCRRQAGFTLVEVLIATMLFTIIMIIGTGAVLNVSDVHKKTQKMRAVIDNLHFIMEDMARNLRLGSSYACGLPSPGVGFKNCDNGYWIFFEGVDGSPNESDDQLAYMITSDGILKKTYELSPDPGNWTKLTPKEVEINEAQSGFTVKGAKPLSTDDSQQPRVIIRLNGVVSYKKGTPQEIRSPFNIQTTVSQRLLDVQ